MFIALGFFVYTNDQDSIDGNIQSEKQVISDTYLGLEFEMPITYSTESYYNKTDSITDVPLSDLNIFNVTYDEDAIGTNSNDSVALIVKFVDEGDPLTVIGERLGNYLGNYDINSEEGIKYQQINDNKPFFDNHSVEFYKIINQFKRPDSEFLKGRSAAVVFNKQYPGVFYLIKYKEVDTKLKINFVEDKDRYLYVGLSGEARNKIDPLSTLYINKFDASSQEDVQLYVYTREISDKYILDKIDVEPTNDFEILSEGFLDMFQKTSPLLGIRPTDVDDFTMTRSYIKLESDTNYLVLQDNDYFIIRRTDGYIDLYNHYRSTDPVQRFKYRHSDDSIMSVFPICYETTEMSLYIRHANNIYKMNTSDYMKMSNAIRDGSIDIFNEIDGNEYLGKIPCLDSIL